MANPHPTFKPLPVEPGQRFGLLTAVERVENGPQRQQQWRFRCDCGTETTTRVVSVYNGNTTSCGCVGRQRLLEHCRGEANANFKHGMSESPEFMVWKSMIQRCQDPNCTTYHRYGARGIGVCRRWQEFANFFADMGYRPTPQHTLERKNGARGYMPSNVVWATRTTQAVNRSTTTWATVSGKRICVEHAAKHFGIHPETVRSRVKRGWTLDDALRKPLDERGWRR